MNPTKTIAAIMAALVLALGMVACGSDDDEESSGGGGGSTSGETAEAIQPVSGAADAGTITIGSKNFTEQYILGNIYADALEAAGFKVKKSLDVGSEVEAYAALKQGEIDGYPEYSGTALTAFFDLAVDDVPKDPQKAFDQLQKRLGAEKITALPQTPFENSFRLVISKEKWEQAGQPKTASELKGEESELRISGFPECKQRIDCLLGIERTYGLKFGKFVASQEKYDVIDNGSADVIFGFTTDGELTTGEYKVLDDDKDFYPPYFVSLLMRDEALEKIGPEGQAVIEQVQKPLTAEVMAELNSRVDLDKQEPEAVAQDYLKESGFIK